MDRRGLLQGALACLPFGACQRGAIAAPADDCRACLSERTDGSWTVYEAKTHEITPGVVEWFVSLEWNRHEEDGLPLRDAVMVGPFWDETIVLRHAGDRALTFMTWFNHKERRLIEIPTHPKEPNAKPFVYRGSKGGVYENRTYLYGKENPFVAIPVNLDYPKLYLDSDEAVDNWLDRPDIDWTVERVQKYLGLPTDRALAAIERIQNPSA